jgi:hypothetical protein
MNWEEAFAYLKEHGSEIGKANNDSDSCAKNIIELYSLLFKCPDDGTQGLLISAIEEWVKKYEQN